MHPCPSCGRTLEHAEAEGTRFWACRSCGGRALSLGRLERIFPGEFVPRLKKAVAGGGWRGMRRCHLCTVHMLQVRVKDRGKIWFLDACERCRVTWFDRGEHEAARGILSPPLPDPVIDGRASIRSYVRPEGAEDPIEVESTAFDGATLLSAVYGLPIPSGGVPHTRSWAAPLLAAAIAVAAVAVFVGGGGRVVAGWGLVPSHPFRHGGLEFVTSFFLHADMFHMAGNLAVLVMFGMEAEEVLGAGRFLLLVALAALGGDLLFIAVQHGSSVPTVGASGGISGILVYWALAFPRSRVRLGVFGRYDSHPVALSLSPRDALFCWVALQLVLASVQTGSAGGGINALAHLGGGAVGWAFWMKWPD